MISEDDFLKSVIDLAHLCGWKVFHARAAMTSKGWRTPVQADGAGFPDLVMIRERVIYAELKSEKGKLSEAQEEWLSVIERASQEFYTWRPSLWGKIVDVLKR